MTAHATQFCKTLGRRIATLRQEVGVSQRTLAAELGIAQQTLAHYEVGRLRVPVWLVPPLAQRFGVPTDTLLGLDPRPGQAGGKRGPTPQLQRRLERLTRLPKAQQQLVLAMLDGLLSHPR